MQNIYSLLEKSFNKVEAYFEMSAANVVLIELTPDCQRKTAQMVPNGKRLTP